MGNIISALLLKFFLKRKCSLLINNEGNICSSDAGIITRKTLSYSEHYFVSYGFKNLIEKCKMSKVISIRIWSDSLKKFQQLIFINTQDLLYIGQIKIYYLNGLITF